MIISDYTSFIKFKDGRQVRPGDIKNAIYRQYASVKDKIEAKIIVDDKVICHINFESEGPTFTMFIPCQYIENFSLAYSMGMQIAKLGIPFVIQS